MKEGYMPSPEALEKSVVGLTPNSLNPYANNGELPMSDTRNNESNREPSLLVDRRGIPFDAQPKPLNLSDHTGKRPLIENQGYGFIPQEGSFKSHDELEKTAEAWARANGEDWESLSDDRRESLINTSKSIIPPDFQYTPENTEFKPPTPIEDVPFSKEVQENLAKSGMIDPELAKKNAERYIQEHPNMPQEMKELAMENAARGIDINSGIKTEGSGKKRTTIDGASEPPEVRKGRENTSIKDMTQLLQEIMDYSDPKWKEDGELSLIKTIVTEKGEVQRVVNQENFMHWIQDRIVFFHGEDPDTALNMFNMVRLEREFKDISIQEMLNNQDKYFRDSYGNQYKDLADYVRLTLWQFSTYRTDDIEYKAAMGDDSGINKIIAKQFYNNSRSKPGFDNMSVFANVLTMAHKFDSNPLTEQDRKDNTRPAKIDLDTNVGNAINTAFLAYFRISDPEKLREVLGDQAKYLLDPEEIRKEVRAVAVRRGFVDSDGNVSDAQARRFLESSDGKPINSAEFLFNGKDVEEKDIIQFINIFNMPTKNTDITTIVNGLMRKAITEKFDLVKHTSDNKEIEIGSAAYAQLMASFMCRPLGAGGRNDLAANANDAITKPMKLKTYRLKMAGGDRAGMVGNPYSVFMLKSVLVDYLNGSRTETLVEDEDGNVIRDSLGNPHYYTQMELMELMSAQGTNRDGVMKYAKKLRPTDISQRDWAQNHMNRGFEMFHDITESNEIDWSKFTDEDTWGNLRLNRGAFEKEFKDHFLKQMRYAYSTYGQLDFSKYVRDYDPDFKNEDGTRGAWYDTPIIDSLFAKQVLDVEEFWKKDYKINKKTGKIEKDKNTGEPIVLKVHEHVIDPNEVQANKKFLWKQLAIARLAADIYAHVDFFSTDPRYKPTYYLMMLEAIESIQDGFEGDEHHFRSVKKKHGHAFTHAQIKWLREAAGITDKRFFLQRGAEDVVKGLGSGFAEAIKGTMKSAFKIA